MGCNNSKVEEEEHEQTVRSTFWWGTRNKVVPVNVPVQDKARISLYDSSSNTARRTEQTVLMQLKEEGVTPKKGEGGIAFVLEIENMSDSDDSVSFCIPGVPDYNWKRPQYATYSPETCRTVVNAPPRRLPPISRASIDAKMERARLNRERKAAERKAKWAKSYARVEAAIQKTADN